MKKSLIILSILVANFAAAGCINLGDYRLQGRYSQSEIDSFESQKITLYHQYFQTEASINRIYTKNVQDLYQRGLPNEVLAGELKQLEIRNKLDIKRNCEAYAVKLNGLVHSFN